MTTPKLKTLLRTAADVIDLFLQDICIKDNYPDFTITPFYDPTEKNSEVVTINVNRWELGWEFLEPLATKLKDTNIAWAIGREEKGFYINLYY